ncbi:MAG: hypothetical protein HXS46_01070 [Theionarchaea archaeon]|nr:hypothetical protein [Theionarchaea archaeon]
MADGTQEKAYLTEHFTTGCILHGKIRDLEEIKRQIIDKYVETGCLRMIKPVYSQRSLLIASESELQVHSQSQSQLQLHHQLKRDPSHNHGFCLAFILNGEVKYCEQVREYISRYVEKGLIAAVMTPYTKEKQYIVNADIKAETE